jgi:putative membrane protein
MNSHGETIPLVQRNILPNIYSDVTGNEPFLIPALLLMITAFVIVLVLDKLSRK